MDCWQPSAMTTGVRPNGAGTNCNDARAPREKSVGGGAR